jgi:recombination protein RecT
MKTDKTGQIQRQAAAAVTPETQITTLIQRMGPEIARALPKHVTPDRMSRIVLTAVRTTPELAECTVPSFLGCVLSLAQLGLEPNTPLGHAYLIPRRNNRKGGIKECTAIIGYKGMMELARRSGQVSSIQAHVVRQGDDFAWQLGSEPRIHHIPADDDGREDRPITHAYATAKVGGEVVFAVLSRAQIEKRRKRGADAQFSPWVTDYEAMCKKTSVRALATWIPQSAELARAAAIDEAPERGEDQSRHFDPAITEALKAGGLLEERHDERPSRPELEGQVVAQAPADTATNQTVEPPA